MHVCVYGYVYVYMRVCVCANVTVYVYAQVYAYVYVRVYDAFMSPCTSRSSIFPDFLAEVLRSQQSHPPQPSA